KSGMLGLSQISNDMREIEDEILIKKNPKAIQAHDVYCYRIKKYIGSYFAALNGTDLLIFTGGVGERMPILREQVCRDLEALGILLDTEENARFTDDIQILSRPESKVTILKIPTNEELMIALDTQKLVCK
ncbi:MAG: acetate kinase, partial [Candidatus Cloacimonetes bacterium]|nr:acetate kinase [Candidatus Cloacimonadota bacterium]